jgi:hypothetical protein
LRQSTRQNPLKCSAEITSLNSLGIPSWLSTSSAAPVAEMLRTTQSIPAPSNAIVPLFSTRWRGLDR